MEKPLLQEVSEATTECSGLPGDLVQDELEKLITDRGYSPNELTLDQLRLALADYMRQVLLEVQDEIEAGEWEEEN